MTISSASSADCLARRWYRCTSCIRFRSGVREVYAGCAWTSHHIGKTHARIGSVRCRGALGSRLIIGDEKAYAYASCLNEPARLTRGRPAGLEYRGRGARATALQH
jgi:hypothetical protein